MSMDDRDRRWATDTDGLTWMVNPDGTWMRDASGDRVPGPAEKISKEGEFTLYDSSRGHCGLCGRYSCRGTCFK